MKEKTKQRKRASKGMESACGRPQMLTMMFKIIEQGKQGLDTVMKGIGRMMAEAIMYMEREELSGPDYQPTSPEIQKWASQAGSVYIGDQKVPVEHPRVRGPRGDDRPEELSKDERAPRLF